MEREMALDSSLAVLVAPFVDMVSSPIFFAEVVVGGLMAGVMYAMVALGFVLIFKASGVFNFAQGVMVLFAALTLVGLMEHGLPVWLALVITAVVMIGLTFFLEGLGELVWGSNVKKLNLGIPEAPVVVGGMLLNQFDLVAAVTAAP